MYLYLYQCLDLCGEAGGEVWMYEGVSVGGWVGICAYGRGGEGGVGEVVVLVGVVVVVVVVAARKAPPSEPNFPNVPTCNVPQCALCPVFHTGARG